MDSIALIKLPMSPSSCEPPALLTGFPAALALVDGCGAGSQIDGDSATVPSCGCGAPAAGADDGCGGENAAVSKAADAGVVSLGSFPIVKAKPCHWTIDVMIRSLAPRFATASRSALLYHAAHRHAARVWR